MSLTKEMMIKIEEEVEGYSDAELLNYHYSYSSLNKHYPNSYYLFRIQKSLLEINCRGLDIEGYMKNISNL